ncbi:MAG: hypothetical protein K9J37_02160 [Saprospiraceae bacterium]|nr:hypothetical protein [Saprospiraceae bacterium]MCF8248683.1 hypothetical protein [Saprospiraceae bacterium]MCF8278827.1 hypothetical protein [Bacteroidales bacterium]MCF8310627.1 hypothetical protein [Saprospiraceae bacterium]MCF8439186.1 hypothetical protein [Saprospiraceae bacterium]
MATIELKPKLKVELNEILNGVAQLDVKELESFFKRIGTLLAHRKTSHLPEREFQLLTEINKGLPEEHRQQYLLLKDKRQQETLSATEAKQLAAMTQEIEQIGVKRLECLVELAKLRGVEVNTLMTQLGIQAPLAYA